MKILGFCCIAVLFLLISPCLSVSAGSVINLDDISYARNRVVDFFSDYDSSELVFIDGSELPVEDQAVFRFFKLQTSGIEKAETLKDTTVESLTGLDKECVVVLGGPKTNLFGSELLTESQNGSFNVTEEAILAPYQLLFGELNGSGVHLLWIYSEKELILLENNAADRSLFGLVLDKKIVPIAATLLSMLLLWLWQSLGTTLIEFFSDFFSEKAKDRRLKKRWLKKLSRQKKELHRFIDLHELGAIFASSLVFSGVLTWVWVDELSSYWSLYLTNFLVVGGVLLVSESLRQYWCFKSKVSSEFVFWPFGAVLTVGSTLLGNTFSLASHPALADGEDDKKFGKIAFRVMLVGLIVVIISYVYNIIYPSRIVQMLFVFLSMEIFIEMFPLPPMDGHDVRKWSPVVWGVFYVFVVLIYIVVNFTMFLEGM